MLRLCFHLEIRSKSHIRQKTVTVIKDFIFIRHYKANHDLAGDSARAEKLKQLEAILAFNQRKRGKVHYYS